MFTFFHGCGIPPITLTCGQGGGAQAQTIGVTGWQGCHVTTPPACLGPTAYPGCTFVGPTGTQGCTQGGGAQAQTGIVTVTTTVIPTAIRCIITGGAGPQAQAQTQHLTGDNGCTMICNNTANCPDQAQTASTQAAVCGPTIPPACFGPTGTQGCTVPPLGPTAYLGCGGPTHLIGCTGYQGCGQPQGTAATLCTHAGCDQNAGGGAQAQVPTIPVADCIPTRSCTGAWPIC